MGRDSFFWRPTFAARGAASRLMDVKLLACLVAVSWLIMLPELTLTGLTGV